MSTHNLEYLRKRARVLVKASPALALHEALRIVARENGFASWSRLRAHVRAECVGRPLMLAGLLVAANRAAETARADALYRDPLACDLAGAAGRAIWEATRQTAWPGYRTSEPDAALSIFTRFLDDGVRRAVAEQAIDQVVILGAAMDTRAFRLAWPANVRLFEVDAPEMFDHKEPVLRRVGARPACRRQTVSTACDGAWARQLQRKGFDTTRKSAFIIERPHYLPEAAAERTMRDVAALASPGSWMGLVLVSRETLRSVFMKPFLDKMDALGLPPWTFGVDDPDAWLDAQGWTPHTTVAGDPDVSYGRWPYGYIPKGTPGVPRTFLTQAWKRPEAFPTARPAAASGTARAPR